MNLIKDKRGMTLIEILVGLLIASIIMVMAGSILLSSMNFFERHANEDLDKTLLDNVFQLVEEELKYANVVEVSEIKLAEEDANGLLYFKIEEGVLLYNGLEMYGDDLYRNRSLEMNIQKKDKEKLYLYLSIKENDKTLLSRTTMIAFDNIPLLEDSEGIIVKEDKVYENAYIYFKKIKQTTKPSIYTGTVADEMHCLNDTNNRGEFMAMLGMHYKYGDFVTYKGSWYRQMAKDGTTTDGITPDQFGMQFKKIDKLWTINSYYMKNDVIMYQNNESTKLEYYISKVDLNLSEPNPRTGFAWEKLTDEPALDPPVCK